MLGTPEVGVHPPLARFLLPPGQQRVPFPRLLKAAPGLRLKRAGEGLRIADVPAPFPHSGASTFPSPGRSFPQGAGLPRQGAELPHQRAELPQGAELPRYGPAPWPRPAARTPGPHARGTRPRACAPPPPEPEARRAGRSGQPWAPPWVSSSTPASCSPHRYPPLPRRCCAAPPAGRRARKRGGPAVTGLPCPCAVSVLEKRGGGAWGRACAALRVRGARTLRVRTEASRPRRAEFPLFKCLNLSFSSWNRQGSSSCWSLLSAWFISGISQRGWWSQAVGPDENAFKWITEGSDLSFWAGGKVLFCSNEGWAEEKEPFPSQQQVVVFDRLQCTTLIPDNFQDSFWPFLRRTMPSHLIMLWVLLTTCIFIFGGLSVALVLLTSHPEQKLPLFCFEFWALTYLIAFLSFLMAALNPLIIFNSTKLDVQVTACNCQMLKISLSLHVAFTCSVLECELLPKFISLLLYSP